MDTTKHLWNVDVKPMVNENMMQLFAPQIFNPFAQNPPSLINCPQPVMPANLTKPPNQWSKEEVAAWLAWCAEEFSIDSVSPERFNMNGRAVCLLNRDDFMQRSPEAGDVLYNALQMLIKRQLPMPSLKPRNNGFNSPTPLQTTIQSQPFMLMAGNQKISQTIATNSPSGPFLTPPLTSPVTTVPPLQQIDYNINKTLNNTPNGIISSPVSSTVDVESVPSEASSNPDPEEMDIPMDQEIRETELPDNRKQETLSNNKGNTGTKRDSDCRLLWEFIYHLLLNNEYSTYICWDNKDRFIFRIVNPHGLAKLWGNQKSRSTMTYEKLSRALRYYYKMEIIKKVPGQRLTYQFMQSPKDIKKGQRGARPHYRLEPFYSNSCRPAPSGSEQNDASDMCSHQAPSTSTRRNSNSHNVLAYSNDLHSSNSHMISDSVSVIKTATGVEHLHSNGVNLDQGHLAFISAPGQVMENSIDRNFATNSKLSRVSSPSAFMGTASSSPLRSNESPQSVLLKSSDIKTEQGFMQFNNGEASVPQLPDYANSFHLDWTKTMMQDEPEDLSMGTRQRITNMDTISHSTPVDDA